MTPNELKKISKSLSYVLRHRPDSIGIELEHAGWIDVRTLLVAFDRSGQVVPRQTLEQVVANNTKQRFEFSSDGMKIRARQGHSLDIDLSYEPVTPPDVLYHGTAKRNLEAILAEGLSKMRRHHVHMSVDEETTYAVAMRHGKPVILAISALRMHNNRYAFFVTGNDVWLTDQVPPDYLTIVE
ncbi:MAG: RNA 2'-phosphotransferase [Planctomycetes bacterium]|nr:RNA 2'-phosphotransferase [Planctomycetota bacterium]